MRSQLSPKGSVPVSWKQFSETCAKSCKSPTDDSSKNAVLRAMPLAGSCDLALVMKHLTACTYREDDWFEAEVGRC